MSLVKPNTLNTQYFTNRLKEDSFVIDLQEAVDDLPKEAGVDYVNAQDWRVKNSTSISADARSVREKRLDDAQTKIIATFPAVDTSDLPDITAAGMIVKKPGAMHLALPDDFETSLPKINAAALDALKLMGAKNFENTEITLVVQRTDIEPDSAHRPHFAHWHTHSEGRENADLVYLWHDVMGTEHKLGGQEIASPDHALTRMGGEQVHRSQTNTTDETIRREWGALVIKNGPQPLSRSSNGMSYNNAVFVKRDDPLFDRFSDAADNVLAQDDLITVLDEPQNLSEYGDDYQGAEPS